jgi:hypothetical protein
MGKLWYSQKRAADAADILIRGLLALALLRWLTKPLGIKRFALGLSFRRSSQPTYRRSYSRGLSAFQTSSFERDTVFMDGNSSPARRSVRRWLEG